MDDIDTPRLVVGSQDRIYRQLEAYGFEWDRLIVQSQRLPLYEAALTDLAQQGMVYECDCTRKQIQQRLSKTGCYDNVCRYRRLAGATHSSMRVITPDTSMIWQDAIQGAQTFDWQRQSGDFIVKRADAIFAYHLVAAVDDSDEGITEVIRGADLLESSAPQQHLQGCLKRTSPSYGHHPLMLDTQTQVKLSKASRAIAIKPEQAVSNLIQVLTFLNQRPPSDLTQANLAELWHWALANWSLEKINPSIKRD